MSFPNRTTRSQLGPRFRDVYPVENPETDLGAGQLNEALDQIAGMNVIVPRVSLAASWGGSAFNIEHQAEAWNSDEAQLHPVLARISAGRYTYTFVATYVDGDGNVVATVLGPPRIAPTAAPATDATPFADGLRARAWRDPGNPLAIKIAIATDALALVDAPFWLEVL